ncbi:YlzJ-like family protein [Heyndrickxia acidiproducens]|uniref:YlzJ-like family protein n=1 Tax=Heyndrickxia acidiproducens TaxID=1121084 RepID=UPI0003826016|nr:YlzJ-like family protein [Heyndrickxia acidiproducens]
MILYTLMPQELIFPEDPAVYSKFEAVQYQGVPILAEQMEEGYRIVRILSSNPYDFLHPDLAPGNVISHSGF